MLLPVADNLYAAGNRTIEGSIAAATYVDENAAEDYWHLARVSVPETRIITAGNEKIIIAVLDTGIDASHPVLQDKILNEINLSASADAADHNGHGTHVAGVIAGGFTEFGFANGIAYDCRLLNVKVANDDGTVETKALVEGIYWAVDNGADVINISLTLYNHSDTLEQAVAYAWENGALVIAAAGNRYCCRSAYPAMYPNVMAVAATDTTDNIAAYSNYDAWVDVSAPGAAIISSTIENGYASMTGTSMATSLVSGEAALLYTLAVDTNHNGRVNDEVSSAILRSCEIIDEQNSTVELINVAGAIDALMAPYHYLLQSFQYR